ncbi:MAG: DUF2617 family protein [Anaerohalosphaera sp.]|nr:DUF2617 family protein [Anaerohalosphaera sp.]
MDNSKTKLIISDLSFSLYQRSLHPELFEIHASRKIKTDKYEADIWATGCSHVITVSAGDMCLCELISLPGQPLPKRGLIERFQFRGHKNHKCSLSRGLSYMTDFQVEKMSANLYRQSHLDLERFAKNRGLFLTFPDVSSTGLEPFSYIDFEARKNELHIHAFHAYPEQITIIKTQSLVGFYG